MWSHKVKAMDGEKTNRNFNGKRVGDETWEGGKGLVRERGLRT